jgi:hypothetical protein
MHKIALAATTDTFGLLGVIGLPPAEQSQTFRTVTAEIVGKPPVRGRLRFVCGVTTRLVHGHGEGTQAVDA